MKGKHTLQLNPDDRFLLYWIMHHWGPTHPDVSTLNIYSCLRCVQGSVNFVISISILHNHDISGLSWGTDIHLVNPSVKLITDYICSAISNFCKPAISVLIIENLSHMLRYNKFQIWWNFTLKNFDCMIRCDQT